MNKGVAKWLALVLSLAIYFTGFWLLYGGVPGVTVSGVLIVVVLWSFLSFLLSGAYKDDAT